ncbi:MAG: PAS domain-containing sensor histidine kinase [Chloroflexi bacterium]|nr:PAS domain-containing sensor histidine kinase [Chloroflexota bacterium]
MAREALIRNEQFFRVLIEHSTDAITLITPDGTITYASPSTVQSTGYTPEELVGRNSFSLLHPDDQGKLREHLTCLRECVEEVLPLEYRLLSKDGSLRWIEGTATNLLDHPQIGAIMCTFRDITGHKRLPVFEQAARKLLDAERTFRSLVESNIVGMMVTDQEGRMYEVNDRLVQLLGYSQEELLSGNLRVKDLLVPEYLSARTRAWKTLLSQGSSLPEEKEYVRKDGSRFSALVAAATINQERSRALVMLLDMTDRKEAERRKQEFLSMVSHELKTPLTIIVGFLELARLCVQRLSGTPSTETNDLLNTLETMLQQAQQQAELETRLVRELLDMSRMEMQKFEISLQVHNLVTIVQQVVANQQQVAPTRRLELVLPLQGLVLVEADAHRIEQVLTNYLTNAFKYSSPEQPVRVEMSVEGVMARVSVRDRGPGLTVEQQQRVWDRFYQVENVSHQGGDGGLGLGLYIARTIIAQHQGQVGVESCPGQGSTFWFILPLADEPAST